jgi:hypothetical protein
VLAPAAALRRRIVPAPSGARRATGAQPCHSQRRYPWADLLKRVFAIDALRCQLCGGRRKILAMITEGRVVRSILQALDLPIDPPTVHPARAPPA